MPRTSAPLHHLDGPFLVRDARGAGVSRDRLYGNDLRRPTHGVRSTTPVDTVERLARAVALALPGDVAFSHTTAALLHGLPLPAGHGIRPLHVMRRGDAARIRRAGCVHHRGLELRAVEDLSGMRVVALHDTWCDLAERLAEEDLVVVGDAVAHRDDGLEALAAAVAARHGLPGAPGLRRALRHVRVGSASPAETRCRLMFAAAGLPEPELNAAVTDEAGEWVATADFLWRVQRVVAEYQGEAHFEAYGRQDSDIGRRMLVEDLGWKYVELTKRDLPGGPRHATTVGRLLRLLG